MRTYTYIVMDNGYKHVVKVLLNYEVFIKMV